MTAVPYLNVKTIKKLMLRLEIVSNALVSTFVNLEIQQNVLKQYVICLIKFFKLENVSHAIKQTLCSLMMANPAWKHLAQRDKSTLRL